MTSQTTCQTDANKASIIFANFFYLAKTKITCTLVGTQRNRLMRQLPRVPKTDV